MTITGVVSIIKDMTHNALTKHGIARIEIILNYLKQEYDKQLELTTFLVSTTQFYPQIPGASQVEIFQYLEKLGFLTAKIEHAYADDDGYYDFENEDWVYKLRTQGRYDFHPPHNGDEEFEIVKNSYFLDVTLASDFIEKYNEFFELPDNDDGVAYQFRIGKQKGSFILYVTTANMGNRKVRRLAEGMTPMKVFKRLLEPKNNSSQPVDISDLLDGTEQTPIQLLNSVLDPALRIAFFPRTTNTSVFVRPIITREMIYTEKVDRTSIEAKLEKLPRV